MIKLELEVDDVDYDALIENYLGHEQAQNLKDMAMGNE